MTPRLSALAVHLFTAIGASLAMLALHEAFQQDWAAMALWLALAFVVDGIDGPLARHFDVKTNAPEIDGVLMDLIIDFLTYVVIPAYALYASGLLPGWSGWLVVLLVPFASAVYFSDTRMKTADNSFSGFPGCWNMVVLALLVIAPPWWVILGLVIVLTAAMFFPLKFVHPVRTERWRALSLSVAVVWTAGIAWAAWTDFASNPVLTLVVAATSVYLLTGRHRSTDAGQRNPPISAHVDPRFRAVHLVSQGPTRNWSPACPTVRLGGTAASTASEITFITARVSATAAVITTSTAADPCPDDEIPNAVMAGTQGNSFLFDPPRGRGLRSRAAPGSRWRGRRSRRRRPQAARPSSTILPLAQRLHQPPGLAYQEIPAAMSQGIQPAFPVAVVAPRRDIGEVQRRRAPAPHAGHLRHQPRQVLQGRGQVFRAAEGHTLWRTRIRSCSCAPTRADPLAVVQPRARALLGIEHLVLGRVEHDARHDLALVFQRDGDRPMGHAVQEVRGPVQRIDDPAPRRVRALDVGAFLAEKPVIGPRAQKFLLQDLLGGLVGAAHEISGPLGRDLQVLHLAKILHQAAPRLSRAALIMILRLAEPCMELILGDVGQKTPARYRPVRPACQGRVPEAS
jgi:phosphatidylcholine synthase